MQKKLLTALIFIGFMFVTPNSALSQTVKQAQIEKTGLDFNTAYELMMANNNQIKAVLEEINAKKYEKRAAIGEYFPKVGINVSATHFNENVAVDIPSVNIGSGSIAIPSLTLQEKNFATASVGANWNIFTGGKISAMNSVARAKLEESNLKYKHITNVLTAELVKSYYGLQFAQNVVEVRRQVLADNEKHLHDAKLMEKEGLIPKSERLHAEVSYRQAKKDYELALKDEDIIEEGLKNLIKADDVDLTNVKIQPLSSLFISNKDIDKVAKLKQTALANNPDYKQNDVKKKIANANYKAKVADYYPTISLYAYDIAASESLSHQVPKLAVGASANFLLFDGLSRYNNLKAAQCVKKQVKYETMNAKNNLETQVIKNYDELLKYKEEYESTNKSIESANESLRTSTLAFKEGMGTSLSVTDAQTALSGIKIERLNALYNYDMKLCELLNTEGNSEKILEYIKDATEEKL